MGAAGPARAAEQLRVVVLPELDLNVWADRGVVGLLVPDAGPTTSWERALVSLVRGETRNSLRGGLPPGPPLIDVEVGADFGPTLGPMILLELPSGGPQRNDRRYPVVVLGERFRGLLTSRSTRIPGLVSIADIAPTALGRNGTLGLRPEDDPLEALRELDDTIREKNDTRFWAALLGGLLLVGLSLAAPRAGVLAFATGLVANLVLGVTGVSTPWVVLVSIALAVVVGAPLFALALRSRGAIALAFTVVLAAYLLALGLDAPSIALSPFGPSQTGRFYGVSNLLETMLLLPALVGAAWASERWGLAGFLAVALLAFAAVAGNRFGADGGGAIVLGVGYAVLLTVLVGGRHRTAAVALAGASALVAVLVAIDAATGGASHVTDALGGGPGGLASDFAGRVVIGFERTVAHWYVALGVVLSLLALLALTVATLRRGVTTGGRALLLGYAAAVLVSLLVNDSPGDVALPALVGCAALRACTLAPRCAGPSSSLSSWAAS